MGGVEFFENFFHLLIKQASYKKMEFQIVKYNANKALEHASRGKADTFTNKKLRREKSLSSVNIDIW
jgi:hypothetical protein